jgi:hypothetical protein
MTKFDWFPVAGQVLDEWLSLCQMNQYHLIRLSELPSIIPNALKAKSDSVLVMASGVVAGEGTAYFMANINRVDIKVRAIDQQPFTIAFVGGEAAGSACMGQHGNWPNRTIFPSAHYWEQISTNGIGYCTLHPELPTVASGLISDLSLESHKRAFEVSTNQVKWMLEEQQCSLKSSF